MFVSAPPAGTTNIGTALSTLSIYRPLACWSCIFITSTPLRSTIRFIDCRQPTFEGWRQQAGPGFCFAVKASRYLTHMKKLKDPDVALQRFFPLVELLGDKLGPILFQLPPHWGCDASRLAQFLQALPQGYRYSFELRDLSWHRPEVYELLERHNAAFCIYELAGFRSPVCLTADFTYVRLHGPAKKAYQGSYDQATLSMWRDRISKWRSELKAVYVYFDNDQSGYAPVNAAQLKKMVQQEIRTAGNAGHRNRRRRSLASPEHC